MVRPADPARDAVACAALYALSVVESAVSFEEQPPGAEEIASRIAAAHDWVVADRDGALAGYACATPFHERAAYRWATSVSIFVSPDHQRQGIGRSLYDTLLPRLAERGFTWAMAGVTLPNPGSVGLHEACGFERVALHRSIGYKAGAWHDVAWFQRALAPLTDPPPPPR